jgi:transposase-like protein
MAEKLPSGLLEAPEHFADPDVCVSTVAAAKWENGPECPKCKNRKRLYYLKTRRMWNCPKCTKQFSVRIGTIFQDSLVPLNKWLCAIWTIGNCENDVSSYDIARELKVTQKTAWFMLHRLRFAMCHGTSEAAGTVRAGVAEIGCDPQNIHDRRGMKMIHGRGRTSTGTPVYIDRSGGEIAMADIANTPAGREPAGTEEYRRFEEVLKKVIRAPPMEKNR